MKTIKAGKIPPPNPNWPIGVECTCKNCGCVWEIETLNDYIVLASLDKPRISSPCPTCGLRSERVDERVK